MSSRLWSEISRRLTDLGRDRRGNVTILMGFMLPALIGGLGLGFEVGNWYLTTRSMQNAADSAVVAAATNGGASYATEARAVAAQYGFVDGINNVTVSVTNTAACPGGGNTCYGVTITQSIPLFLAQVIGFTGNAMVNSGPAQHVTAAAGAQTSTQQYALCLLALASSGAQGITTNGAPNANLSGCNVMSNTSADCHGHNLQADNGLAHGTDSGCGVNQISNVPTVTDPYVGLAHSLPTNSCASYPQETKKGPVNWTQWSGSKSLSGNVQICGDLELTGDVTIDAPSGAVLVIENGQLDTGNGHALRTANGSALTVVFSGDGSIGSTHAPTGSGTLDIAAPTSGTWKGIAIYQDPNLTSGVDISAAGNSPTWDITGLVYLPHSSVTFSGAVDKSSNGQSCFVMVVDNVTINGTGSILRTGGCAAGLTMPVGIVPGRGQLVN
jgi:Putative Flp pilus-assembly TadE/G-like